MPKRTIGSYVAGWVRQALILLGLWCAIGFGALLAYYVVDLPDISKVIEPQKRPYIMLEAADGSVFARYGNLQRAEISVKDVPKYLPQAIVAIEDRRFYQHFGIDVWGLLRAFVINLRAGHVVQGGSTITQQLAKNSFLTPERTFKRKVQEMLLAFQLERAYSKDQIISAYMNRVYLGSGLYGVSAAAEVYFSKNVSDLSLYESAILAAMLRAPSKYSPIYNKAVTYARARVVLDAMVECGYITAKQKKIAVRNNDLPIVRKVKDNLGDGRYFGDWVMSQIDQLAQDSSLDLVVRTTLDLKMLRSAERHIQNVLDRPENKPISQASLISLAPDGAVLAMVGGRNYLTSQFNRATQALRQPGSAIKPIIYLTAIEHGVSPDDVIEDAPITLGSWSPQNYDNKFRGNITVREALTHSVNTVAVRLLQLAGIGDVIKNAKALGITSPIAREMTLALGTNGVTPLELTSVYASLASGGQAIIPYGITAIHTRDGRLIWERPEIETPQVVDAGAVAALTDMMKTVVQEGTGMRARLGDRDVAGKTGTSADYRDAWFLGFTADYITSVWVGNDNNAPMPKVTGGSAPAQIWHDYMVDAERDMPERSLGAGYVSHSNGGADTAQSFQGFIQNIIGGSDSAPADPTQEPEVEPTGE